MKNLHDLQRFFWNLGWFSGEAKLVVTLSSEFEGYYGKASETWEKQASIEIISPDTKKCPNLKIVGERFEGLEEVAFKVISVLKKEGYLKEKEKNE